MGATFANDSNNVENLESENLNQGDVKVSYSGNFNVSNMDSISETNLVDSQIDAKFSDTNSSSTNVVENNHNINNNADNSLDISSKKVSSENQIIINDIGVNNLNTIETNIISNDLVKYYKNATHYTVILTDTQGNPLEGMVIWFTIADRTYSRITDNKGVATFEINLLPGDYVITTLFNGTNKYSSSKVSNNIKVKSTLEGNDLSLYYRNGSYYYVTVVDGQGNPLVGSTVNFNVNGVFYPKDTDSQGIAKLTINLYPDDYIITAIHPDTGLMISNIIKVLKMDTLINLNQTTFLYSSNQNFTLNLVDKNGKPLENTQVYIKLNNNVYYATTNNNGVASFILGLDIGKYEITYGYSGNSGYSSVEGKSNIDIINSTTSIEANDLNMTYNDGSSFNVILSDVNGSLLANKNVSFILNGQTYNKLTDENGIATITINLYPGTYTITYSYSTEGKTDYNKGSNIITVSKIKLELTGNDLVMWPGDDSSVYVKLTQKGSPVANQEIIFTVNGKEYTRVTNASGIASIKINLGVGFYEITYKIANEIIYEAQGQSDILVNGTFLNTYSSPNIQGDYFYVILTDALGNPLSGESIKFNINGADYIHTTNNEGIAGIQINLSSGSYLVVYSYEGGSYPKNSGQYTIVIDDLIKLNDVISEAEYVKNYIANNYKLPDSVNIGGHEYSMSQLLYLLFVAIIQINNEDTSNMAIVNVDNPTNPLKGANLGNLYKEEYLSIAQTFIGQMPNGVAPNYASSSLGNIGFESLIYAYARAVAYYGNNGVLPAYTAIKSVEVSVPGSVLNDPYNGEDLAKYLEATKNCQVNDPVIQALAASLTEGLTDDLAKATAIFNYVRDNIPYWSYSDTRYGAVGTLNVGGGNCVDQSHLLTALYRAADLPTRYVHGICYFTTGGFTIGHVWTQVLIGDTWVVADTTSSRNSLGSVVNWDNYGYTLHGKYAQINF
ncbi:hypothetical protein LJC03_05765 [Methanobrevibacter sp. OttesenSCG-928-I08]|nr:hypothetical protein [Methanobrevibacter sp. OttesenSCG-928-I08]